MCSFMHYNYESKIKLYFYYLKAICCALFQTAGLVIFIYNAIKDTDKDICQGDGEWDIRSIATVATLYISLTMGSMIQVIDTQGLYEVELIEGTKSVPPFISPRWLFVGIYVNNFSLMGAIFGSVVVIYISESALDVVLNSVALFFVVEMDDLMIDDADYDRICNFFKDKYNPNNYIQPHSDTKFQSAVIKCSSTFIILLVLIAILGAMGAPFYMAICF